MYILGVGVIKTEGSLTKTASIMPVGQTNGMCTAKARTKHDMKSNRHILRSIIRSQYFLRELHYLINNQIAQVKAWVITYTCKTRKK